MLTIPLNIRWIGLKSAVCARETSCAVNYFGLTVEDAGELAPAAFVVGRVRSGHEMFDRHLLLAFPTSESV